MELDAISGSRGDPTSNLRKRVLVLDNDPDFLLHLEHLLEDQGFHTAITWNMWEALAWLSGGNFDAVLMGDHPPEVNCAAMLQRARAISKDVACLVLQSAPRYPFHLQYLRSLGASAVVPRQDANIVEELRHVFPGPGGFSGRNRAAAGC